MRYCIAIVIHGEIEEYFKHITSDLSERFGLTNLSLRVPPHITLKYPFRNNLLSVEDLEKSIEIIATSKQVCDFMINSFDNFEKKTMFLSISPNKIFEKSIKSCMHELGEFNEDRKFGPSAFRPHISIARNMTGEQFDAVRKYLDGVEKPSLIGEFNNICLLEEVGNNEGWKIRKGFNFSNLFAERS